MALSDYLGTIVTSAQKYGINPADLWGVLSTETSNGNPNAVSPAGALGIGQFLPSTAANPGYGIAPFNPLDPVASIDASAHYLATMQGMFGEDLGIIAYNAGPGNVAKYGAGAANLSGADSGYLSKVLSAAQSFPASAGNALSSAVAVPSASANAGAAPSGASAAPVTIPSGAIAAFVVFIALFLGIIALGAF